MLSPDNHDELVLRLYDHATEADLEAMFMPWVSAFNSSGAHCMLLDRSGAVVETWGVSDGVDTELMSRRTREYETDWRGFDPRMELALRHPNRAFSDVQHIDHTAFERSEMFHICLGRLDLRYSFFANLHLANGYAFAHSLMRGASRPAYAAEECAAIERLWPHVRRAFDLRLELDALRSRVADLGSALDTVPSPLFVVDARGRVRHCNLAAERLLAARDALVVRNQQLVTTHSAATAQLRAAVVQAVAYADQPSHGKGQPIPPMLVVEVARAERAPLAVVVHPIRPRLVLRTHADDRARALVVVHDPETRARVDRELIERMHGLTPTEAELAATLAEGKSLAEFADARGCSEGTARVHLKRVFEKTGTRRQAELVHRILASAALYAVEH
jgi:DNA-binding CsgD family transcriptional regulator